MSDPRAERARTSRCIRRLIVLTSAVSVALGTAAPAFSSGGEEGESIATAVLSTVASATEPAPQPSTAAAPSGDAQEPTASEEEAGLDALAEVVTAVESDPGNVNVSVRVLSPGVDEPVTQENPASSLISSEPEPDITALPDTSAEEATAGDQPSSSPSTVNTNVAIRVLSPGTNGEVSQQNATTAGATEGSDTAEDGDSDLREVERSAAEDEPTSDAEPGAAIQSGTEVGLLDSGVNSDGYQEEDSQYQSDSSTSSDAWYWSWWYTIDCDGNATTSSTESGSPSSLDWTWKWMWDWSCTDGEPVIPGPDSTSSGAGSGGLVGSSSTTSSAPGNTNVSIRVLSPGENGPVSQTTTSSSAPARPETTGTAPADEPWNWSWTFAFCDQTTALVTETPSGTPLSWTWEWAWNWSCDAAVGPPPSLSESAQPGEVADSPAAGSDVAGNVISVPWGTISDSSSEPQATSSEETGGRLPGLSTMGALPSLAGLGAPAVDVVVDIAVAIGVGPQLPASVLPRGPLSPPTLPGVEVSVVVVTEAPDTPASQASSPLETPSGPLGRKSRGNAAGPAADAPGSTIPPPTTSNTSTSAWQPRPGPENRVASTPTVKHPSARPAPPERPRALFSPFGELGTSQGTAAGTSGALVPSAPVVAVAVLTALFVLVAPRPGRRIRLARELSPRGTYRSSIDHPG